MATSTSDLIYVWVWLPGATEPVPAGVLRPDGNSLSFRYGDKYLLRADAMSIYGPTLPLSPSFVTPLGSLRAPGPIRDAAPDSWGRRVILNRSNFGGDQDVDDLTEGAYLLRSGSNRLGAIDFQGRSDTYTPRSDTATLDELHQASRMLEAGEDLSPEIADALINGTAIGGARPKALIRDGGDQYIAKFETSSDIFPVVGAEQASMYLARKVGIDVTESRMVSSLGRDVLLMKRFDRPGHGTRRLVVSALTMLGLDENTFSLGSYPMILDVLRDQSADPARVGRDVFQRVAFNIAISNTDDHLRNHAVFWDGQHTTLTPAYDLSPCVRGGDTANQAIAFGRYGERQSDFASLVKVCHIYGLSIPQAIDIIDEMVELMDSHWEDAADSGHLTQSARKQLRGRQILNPATRYGYKADPVDILPSSWLPGQRRD
jgi:serine/threonine-protein kinase HipA